MHDEGILGGEVCGCGLAARPKSSTKKQWTAPMPEQSFRDVEAGEHLLLQTTTMKDGHGQLNTVCDLELSEHGPKMILYGLQRKAKHGRDLLVGQALGNKVRNLRLSGTQGFHGHGASLARQTPPSRTAVESFGSQNNKVLNAKDGKQLRHRHVVDQG